LRQRSTEVIRYLSQRSGGAFPIVAVGGISSGADALEKLRAGATLVQVYTGFVYQGPAVVREINEYLMRAD
ncbi:MAG: dihydroorotate dehydrogenase (quinone), partial [Cytophagales bacterium]|nr:dihydroorotate dehydrogenase (quinone) [Cytophagales bacterium]